MRTTGRLRFKKGFTLMEAVFSIALLLLVCVPVIEALIITKITGSIAKHKAQAIYLAQMAIEDLHKKSFSQIINSTSSVIIDTKGTPDDYSDDFAGTQTVTVTNTSPYYKKVVVEVSWNEKLPGITKSMSERCGSFITNDPQAN